MSHEEPPTSSLAGGDGTQASVCVLLACFDGAKRASAVRRPLGKEIRQRGAILDEVVLRVSGKRKVQVYDPRRVVAGTLTSALTWGLFGLLAGGGWSGLVVWAVLGAVCGGLYAYFSEHLLTKTELKRIGALLAPDSSAIVAFVETPDPQRILAPTSAYSPLAASVAAIRADLSADVVGGTSDAVAGSESLVSMLLLRFKGQHTVRRIDAQLQGDNVVQPELLFEVDGGGKAHVSSPSQGVASMAKSDVMSWGLFGVAFGAIAGFFGGGGILGFLEDGAVTGIAWAIFGLAAGALYGLWAGRAVSARRLKGLAPLLQPDMSLMLAWAGGAVTGQTIDALSTPDTERLILRFNPVANGVVLDA